MKDAQNIAIGLLLTTAVILTVILIGSYTHTGTNNTAYAGASVKQADYIMGTGAMDNTTDLVYVVDIATRRLNVYQSNINTNVMDILDSVDLDRAFGQ